jgi:hypothetical protein
MVCASYSNSFLYFPHSMSDYFNSIVTILLVPSIHFAHSPADAIYPSVPSMPQRHPLQRFASPGRSLSLITHLIGIASFSASFQYLNNFPQVSEDSFGGHFQYLTILGLTTAFLSFVFGALADLTLIPIFFDIKNVLSVCSAPLEVLISTLYWGIRMIDPNLLFPPELRLPFLPDFGFHAAPALLLAVDLLLFSPPWAVKAQGAMGLSTAIAFLYWGWVEWCFSYNGV